MLSVAQGLARSTDVVAAIMLLMAAAIAGYAIFLYLQRAQKLELIGDEVSRSALVTPGWLMWWWVCTSISIRIVSPVSAAPSALIARTSASDLSEADAYSQQLKPAA